MKTLIDETKANFESFVPKWQAELSTVSGKLKACSDVFLKSYRRIVSLQAWRAILLEPKISKDSLAFFVEAQNDALTSHVFGQLGSWRTALSALRSCIDNTMSCLFYMDHPVELQLWHLHQHRLSMTELREYVKRHPLVRGIPSQIAGVDGLVREYGLLSSAVHGSAVSFRMTRSGDVPKLWGSSKASLGAWSTREGHTLMLLNLILTTLFREDLKGSKLPNLRKAISLVVPPSKHASIRSHLGVRLYRS